MLGPAGRRGVVDDDRGGPLGPALGQFVADVDPVHVVEVGAEVRHPVAVHHARQPDAERQGPGVAGHARSSGGGGQDTVSTSSSASGGVGSLSNSSISPPAPRRTASSFEPPMSTPTQAPDGTTPEGVGTRSRPQSYEARPLPIASAPLPAAPPGASPSQGEAVQRHRRGRRHVERIDARGHGYAHRPAHGQHRRAQARALRPDHDGHPLALQLLGDRPRGCSALERGVSANSVKPLSAHQAERRRPGAKTGERDPQHQAERDPDAPAVERVGTGGVDQDGAGAESGSVAEDGTQVFLVVHPLDDHHRRAPGRRQQAGRARQGQPRRQARARRGARRSRPPPTSPRPRRRRRARPAAGPARPAPLGGGAAPAPRAEGRREPSTASTASFPSATKYPCGQPRSGAAGPGPSGHGKATRRGSPGSSM